MNILLGISGPLRLSDSSLGLRSFLAILPAAPGKTDKWGQRDIAQEWDHLGLGPDPTDKSG